MESGKVSGPSGGVFGTDACFFWGEWFGALGFEKRLRFGLAFTLHVAVAGWAGFEPASAWWIPDSGPGQGSLERTGRSALERAPRLLFRHHPVKRSFASAVLGKGFGGEATGAKKLKCPIPNTPYRSTFIAKVSRGNFSVLDTAAISGRDTACSQPFPNPTTPTPPLPFTTATAARFCRCCRRWI